MAATKSYELYSGATAGPLPWRGSAAGAYHQWTRKIDGKAVTRILSDDQIEDYQPWFDNHRRLRELIAELETLSQAIADADPRWNRRTGQNIG